jgi:hypothetical protein
VTNHEPTEALVEESQQLTDVEVPIMRNGRQLIKRHSAKMVAIAVPMSNRAELTADERISFRHLIHYLGQYDKYLVAPKSLDIDYPGFGLKRFSDSFFGSTAAHKRLMLSRRFYQAFSEYEFVLIYHPDALVFSDQLKPWCEAGYDYIGAPWFNTPKTPENGFEMVGNGGFSLRRIASFLKVIDSPRYAIEPATYWETYWSSKPAHLQYFNLPKKYLKRLRVFNGARWRMSRFRRNEDHFWSEEAVHYYPQFKVAPVEAGLRFAFECAPKYCYEMNGRRLPFGCHAWSRYDRDFWEPFLLT